MLTAVRTKKFTTKPAAPEADPRFQTVKAKVGQKAAQIKKHPRAKLKAEEAAKAAKAPPKEKQAGAQEKQTDLMKAAKAEKVEPDNFRALLRAEIKKVMPDTLDDADNFMEGGKQEQMKGAVSGKVSEQKSNAESQIKTTAKQKPNTAGVPIKEVKDLPETPLTPVPTVNAAEAMPTPRTEAEISQQQSKSDADQQFKDAQITTKQLKKADEPRFTAVLDAKKEVETVADASPAKYRAQEKALLGQTAAKAQSDGRRNMFALAGVKTKSGAAVKSRQLAAKSKDEKARKEVTDNIEAMYNTTKMLVELHLSTLEITVFSMFDSGSANAIAAMKSDTTREIDDYKDDRYSGIRGKARWVVDQFRATPKAIVKIIEKNLQIFKAAMDALVDRVANTVETRLQQAKDEIDKGQTKIKNYVSGLKGSLKDVGKAAEKEVAGRFDEMRAGVEDRKNALAQKLAESYKAAIDKGNTLASEMEAENAGAAYKLAKKIAEIAQLILDFKDKLVAILKKAVSVILDILSDPIGFFGNLIDALKQGFSQFTKNFANNFKEAIAKWLFGNLGGEGFELPKDLSAPSILKLVMGVAGLTYNKIRGKAVKLIGERNVALLEKLYEYLKILFTGGADALWTEVKKDFGNLQETVVSGIKSWLMTALVEAGIKKLLTMFIPGGGFVQAALAIYKIVVFIVERATQIADFISSIVDSVADIVSGSISAAASRIEKALIQALALIIDLLARIIGLSGIAQTIKSLIKKVQDKVEKAIDFVIEKVVQTVKKLSGKLTGKDRPDNRTTQQKEADLKKAVTDSKTLEKKERKPAALAKALEKIKKKYNLSDLSAKRDETGFAVHAAVNPEITFQLDAEDDDKLTVTFSEKAAVRIAALKGGSKIAAVKTELDKALNDACKDLRLKSKDKNLSYQSGTMGNNVPMEIVFLENSGVKKKVGGIWSESQLYKSISNPVKKGKATTFKNVVTGDVFVHDAKRQYVQRFLIRNLSDNDLKNMRKGAGILPTGETHKVTIQEHVMGKKPSPFISATKTPGGQITNEKGESFNSGDQAKIDLCYISSKNIFDLSTKVGQDEWKLSNPDSPKAVQAEKDVIRTQEVLIRDDIPMEAVKKL